MENSTYLYHTNRFDVFFDFLPNYKWKCVVYFKQSYTDEGGSSLSYSAIGDSRRDALRKVREENELKGDMELHVSFRPEFAADEVRVEALLGEIETVFTKRPGDGDFPLATYTVKIENDIQDFYSRFKDCMYSREKYDILHRCIQTMQIGTEANEDWYKKTRATQKFPFIN